MNRRRFVKSLAAIGIYRSLAGEGVPLASQQASSWVNTVRGPVPLDKLGMTLMHEHVLVDFIGADKVSRERYSTEEVFNVALPFLKKVHSLGCRSLVECTPAYLGRDPGLLRRLSEVSGLNILTNTGYYGASDDKYVPKHAFTETAQDLAAGWIREFQDGIDGTGIKPGIMKISVDKGPLSEIDAKLVRAAALTHLKTGLTIASHTEDGTSALEELDLLNKEGVAASAFIWVHAHIEPQTDKQLKAARRGAWIEFDGISEKSLEQHVKLVKMMIDAGLLHRTLISQDAGWYHVGERGGGQYRSYESLFTRFIPALKKSGATDRQIRQLLTENPRTALQAQVRRQSS
jgi:phosphotriesterase-related protein